MIRTANILASAALWAAPVCALSLSLAMTACGESTKQHQGVAVEPTAATSAGPVKPETPREPEPMLEPPIAPAPKSLGKRANPGVQSPPKTVPRVSPKAEPAPIGDSPPVVVLGGPTPALEAGEGSIPPTDLNPPKTVPTSIHPNHDSANEPTQQPADTEAKSGSVGHPRKGRLRGGVQLKPATGIRILRADRAWATEDTVYDLLDAVDTVRRIHPNVPTLLIGDMSTPKGGPLAPHQSHQSGRDVDVGLFFKDAPKEGLDHFAKFDSRAFDAAATWTLVAALIGRDATQPKVKHIFLAWEIQELLRKQGAKAGLSRKTLDLIFQFPRGGGIVRHVEGHDGHLHVRFPCGKADTACTDFNSETVAFQKARRKCVKRRGSKNKSKLQQLLADDSGAGGKAKSPDVHCFMIEYE